jgi:two-component system phosphate regulon sensor histidine kinase PhoR
LLAGGDPGDGLGGVDQAHAISLFALLRAVVAEVRMRIQQRLLVALVALVASVSLPAAYLLNRWISEEVVEQARASLIRETRILGAELNRAPPEDLFTWIHATHERAGARITIIEADGRVSADSDVLDLAKMDNHGDRPEIRAAFAGEVGTSLRPSTTFKRDLLYVAVAFGKPLRVLRLSRPIDITMSPVWRGQRALWLSATIALVLAFLVGGVLTRWLARPLTTMTHAARAMAKGKFQTPLPEPSGDELGELARALATLRNQLAARIEELRAEGDKLRTILNGMKEGVALIQEGRVTVANSAFAEMIGATVPLEGRSPLEAARLPELAEAIHASIEERQPEQRELQVGNRHLSVDALPLGTPESEQTVVVLQDLTESRKLERLRRDLVANASHELRTPVAAILGAAETLSAGAAEDAEARASFVDILLRHAQRLSRLTTDLLDLSRLEAGYRPRIETVDVAEVVQTVVGSLASKAGAKQILLENATPAVTVAAERPALEQVLTNLVDNAIKYTTQGGSVRVTAEPEEGQVRIVVADTGVGIAAEHLPRLWERFYRVDAARSRELGGTGLGLAIVKHLVLSHGGSVDVESEVGRGSSFIVRLPRG